jgi:hypothetical protein
MIEEETTGGLDFGILRIAIEGRDPDALLGFYAEDACLRIVNGDAPDGPVFELKGRWQIERYLRAVCDQQMTCLVEGEVVIGEGSIAFGEVCDYPDGTLISVRTTLEVAGGRILRQLDVVERSSRRHEQEEEEVGPGGF